MTDSLDTPRPLLSKKERMKIDRQLMPEQEAIVRSHNFREVNLGFTEQLAILEAERCLQCPKPYCVDGPEFDGHLVDFRELSDRLSTYRPFEQEAMARREACQVATAS